MIRRNTIHMFRYAPGVSAMLIICMSSVICVIVTIFGTLISLGHFYSDYRNVRYMVDVGEGITSSQLLPTDKVSCEGRIIFVSSADPKTGAVVIGIGRNDGWMPANDVELLQGSHIDFINISRQRDSAFVDSSFYNLYENIEPWIDQVKISDRLFKVVGTADFYFSRDEYEQVVTRTENDSIVASLMNEELRVYDAVNGEPFAYPNALGTLLISAHDFIELDLPTAFISIVFRDPPSNEEHKQIRSSFRELNLHMEEYRSGSRDINLAHVNAVICIIAISIALLLVRYLIEMLLYRCEDVWRGLFIMGCRRLRIARYMISQFLIVYVLAGSISFYPCSVAVSWLVGLNISVEISAANQVLLTVACVSLMLFASIPAILSALHKYTREDGRYVSTY